mmetsp:Transcript_15517/g.20214  ORF Transcript_15517/g.20214 Transcript_15517/m.20214 type:complete len:501 (-) Transcript_15517:54-1556(-)|eukprot:CAMPEP_0116050684 /NCGR_PEP_ID=MMETSP0322-20121206/529_1 /TAXON_ID=163516 /ORGANISM="Leptocylindrus danicus var. apora, Strain B651" /LENGTH=500 /DNA_ID=CAMNT_0003533285 /DNA_START=43 /DNA_END=1545 /DNA_ORIENTATION=+
MGSNHNTIQQLFIFIICLYSGSLLFSHVLLPRVNLSEVVFPGWNLSDEILNGNTDRELERDRKHATLWPPSIRFENNYETILHPADKKSSLSVPRFYSDHLTDGRLMTRDEALKFGSKVPVVMDGGTTEYLPTIYVAIASYRDWQCRYTVESIFNRAKYPERVRVGVVDQIEDGEDAPCDIPIEPCDEKPEQALCKYQDRLDVFHVEAALSVGPVFARHIGHRMYRGEYFAMQSDAHVTFVNDWDVDIISQFESTGNEMSVLSTYLSDIQGSIDADGNSLRHTRPIMCNTDYERDTASQHLRHGSQPEAPAPIKGSPQMEPYWAAGFSFSRGHFVVNVPYDLYQPMVFQGEEISITVRGFTWGYDFYAPERSVCFHMYAVGKNEGKRKKVSLFWENTGLYQGAGRYGMMRLLGIIGMNRVGTDPRAWNHAEETKYGLGKVRSKEKFFETFGIHTETQTVEHHLCRFVQTGQMHIMFKKLMRRDGMGVDYSKVTYKFHDSG